MSSAQKPLLCYVTDRKQLHGRDLLDAIRAALDTGVDWVQIREKDLPTRELLALAREAVAAAEKSNPAARILINDRLDVALAARAHGIHLGGESMPVAEVVRWCRSSAPNHHAALFLVGASCHSVDEVKRAASDGASYAILGPVFETPSKTRYGSPLGLAVLAEACAAVKIPVLAVGGITEQNANACVEAGAAGVAAIRWFQQAQ